MISFWVFPEPFTRTEIGVLVAGLPLMSALLGFLSQNQFGETRVAEFQSVQLAKPFAFSAEAVVGWLNAAVLILRIRIVLRFVERSQLLLRLLLNRRFGRRRLWNGLHLIEGGHESFQAIQTTISTPPTPKR